MTSLIGCNVRDLIIDFIINIGTILERIAKVAYLYKKTPITRILPLTRLIYIGDVGQNYC